MLTVPQARNALQQVQLLATRVHLLPRNQQHANNVLKEVTLIRVLRRVLPAELAFPARQLQNRYVLPDHIPSLDLLSARHAMKESTLLEVLLSARIAKPVSTARKALRRSATAGSGQLPTHQAVLTVERGTLAPPLR